MLTDIRVQFFFFFLDAPVSTVLLLWTWSVSFFDDKMWNTMMRLHNAIDRHQVEGSGHLL